MYCTFQESCAVHVLIRFKSTLFQSISACQVYREKLKAQVEGRPYQLPPASSIMASAAAASSAGLPPRNRSFSSAQAADKWDDWGGSNNSSNSSSMKVTCLPLFIDPPYQQDAPLTAAFCFLQEARQPADAFFHASTTAMHSCSNGCHVLTDPVRASAIDSAAIVWVKRLCACNVVHKAGQAGLKALS